MSRTITLLWSMLALLPAVAAAQQQPLRVYAGIAPIQYLVDRVAGNDGQARVLVRAGQRPETYEPTPRQLAALARADAFFGVGMPLEKIWRRQLRGAAREGPRWVDLSRALEDGGHDDHDHGAAPVSGTGRAHGHHHGRDPHVWLSPVNARRMVAVIRDTLARLRPEAAQRYAANADLLSRELDALHRDIQMTLGASPVEAFLVFHPAWGHFAGEYGLEQLAIESQGKQPGPRSLAEVIEKAKAAGIRTVFLDPQHSTRLAETVAEAIDGEVGVLDPLAYDYQSNLRQAARAIAGSGQ